MQELRRRQHWLEEVRANGFSLEDAPEDLRADKEVALAAVNQEGSALEYASEDLRADKEVVLAALKNRGYSLGISPPKTSGPTRRSSLRP